MSHCITDKCTGCTVCAKICPVQAVTGEKQKMHRIIAVRCIDCGACGRSCPSAAIQDSAGETVSRIKRTEWLKPVFNISKCISCTACAAKCPAGCITMSKGIPGGNESYPSLSAPNKCVSCGWCTTFCPASCISLTFSEPTPQSQEKAS